MAASTGVPGPWARWILALLLACLLVACGGGGGDGQPTAYTSTGGVAQKGPLIRGSTVTVQELDARLSPTGRQYSYQVTTDLGGFSPTSPFGSRHVGVTASGYYYDEARNALSSGPVTLTAYRDLAASPVLNVNLLTTLAYQRIQRLVTVDNLDYAAAQAQSEREVLAALGIPVGAYGAFGDLAVSGGTDGARLLAAVSALFVQGRNAGELSALIASMQADIGTSGAITSEATRAALRASAAALDPAAVAANLTQAFGALGVAYTAADIAGWLDADGDGVAGRFEFRLPDATPASRYTLPAGLVAQLAGAPLGVSAGVLWVNGVQAAVPAIVSAGDVVSVAPAVAPFPGGVLAAYLTRGTTRLARVSFASGLQSITVSPAAASVPRGVAQPYTATGQFTDGAQADITGTVGWTSDAPAVATVHPTTGVAQSLAQGLATVRASLGAVSGSAGLTVTAAQLVSLQLLPSAPQGGPGTTTAMKAMGTYTDGTTADLTQQATWSSTVPAVATVGSGTGVVTGVAAGSATLSAAVGAVARGVTFTVSDSGGAPAAAPLLPRTGHEATRLPNGKVLVTGGASGAASRSAELYDPSQDRWTAASPMLTARARHRAVLLNSGKVLVLGGFVGTPANAVQAEVYDPATDRWDAVATPPLAPNAVFRATLLASGEVLVTGGTGFDPVLNAAALYDPASDRWRSAPPIPDWPSSSGLVFNRHGTSYRAVLLPTTGQVLVLGGLAEIEIPSNAATAYDPETSTWSVRASMSRAYYDFAVTVLRSGQVLVSGGNYADLPNIHLATTEVYDPVLNRWTSTGSLARERSGHTSSLMPDGSVLVLGGVRGALSEDYPLEVERLPLGGTAWQPAGRLLASRLGHTATLLGNGKLLLVGGATAELRW